MPAATGFERAASLRRTERADAMLRVFHMLLDAADHLVPPLSAIPRDAELPAEWFKYPPV
jgi:hypothetical protein